MKIHLLFCLFFIAIASSSFSQQVIVTLSVEDKKPGISGDTIYYDFDRLLTWNDFAGKPDNSHFGGAVTASGFAFDSESNFDGRNIYLHINVYTFFSRHESWKKTQINSKYHLVHEQHHFDITRLGAQKFVEEISKAHFTKENYNALVNSLFEKAYRENSTMQHQYDQDTMHSIDKAKQQEWNNRVAGAIQRLKETLIARTNFHL